MSEANNSNQNTARDESRTSSTWDELRAVIQDRWSELTTDDLDNLKGRVDRLVTLVQERYAISVEDARRQVSEFEQTLEEKSAQLYDNFSSRIGARYRSAREGINDFADDVRTYGLGSSVVDVARTYPVAAVTAAFLLGALVAGSSVRGATRRRRWY